MLPMEIVDNLRDYDHNDAQALLTKTARDLYAAAPGTRVRRYLRDGDAQKEILNLAKEIKADLIILGSHGRSGIERLVLGSVANAVVSRSPCSALILILSPEEIEAQNSITITEEDLPDEMKADLGILVKT